MLLKNSRVLMSKLPPLVSSLAFVCFPSTISTASLEIFLCTSPVVSKKYLIYAMTGDNPVGAMVTGLAWAVPVKPVKLIAHLEAYVQHKQAIRSLGLCVRFGRGPQAYVTKISFEIRSMIEAQIIAETVNEMEALWSERMGCFELECGPFSHLTPEEKARRYPAYQESNRNGNNSLRFPHPHRDEYDRHNDRAEAWSALFSRHTPAKPNSFRYRFDNVGRPPCPLGENANRVKRSWPRTLDSRYIWRFTGTTMILGHALCILDRYAHQCAC